ncbi:hypothetical protein SERLA73DRAFT_190127 [Serpula lacrymans var. lacrymans S7.3]|uniref:Folylpolyglutamate synthase n=2 Tax=Serpula lacrymans var. lacrymans TaxID=341189 RepID=F8QF47_SERL3|nr:uncharacterized protein SERLADRAFT_461973 [Serpula lacrymans var. lacrymans S7.9]EGN93006.1 hypothetical protein SERLA73DRAFT_190127 [Serpula lacrymans var. lacrymans S7.3]EGO27845.1 hypothetical protein SERLADRAFT_461973 [Serpula lacrymans var. lacrymans S7.9]
MRIAFSLPFRFRSLSVNNHRFSFTSRKMSTRSYKDAIEHLNTLQSNAATLEAVRAAGARLNPNAIPETIEYLGRIGYTTQGLNRLNVIHITGTKGKGSTSAFTDSILRHAKPDWNVGLYSSPHLVAVRERIRINGKPISEEVFAKFFFEVWDRLKANDVREDPATPPMPNYFRYLTLLAYHAFLTLKVDATILEVGIGGASDSTNIVPKPIVAGVTALGLDHTSVLGKTISEIAWQKGGIYKEGVPALTVNQPEEGMKVLQARAEELKASEFTIVPFIPGLSSIKLGLAGEHQVQNAALAVSMARIFLSSRGALPSYAETDNKLPKEFIPGLENTKWPGRCQTVPDPQYSNTTWFLDGAHTVESLDCCVQWFISPGVGIAPVPNPSDISRPPRVLIFNCTNGRSGTSFLGSIITKARAQLQLHGVKETTEELFDHVIFCSNVTYADGGFKGDLTSLAMPTSELVHLKTQHELADAWTALVPSFPTDAIHVLPSIEHAVNKVRTIASPPTGEREVNVLVTGSLHLVGGIIEVAGLSAVAL